MLGTSMPGGFDGIGGVGNPPEVHRLWPGADSVGRRAVCAVTRDAGDRVGMARVRILNAAQGTRAGGSRQEASQLSGCGGFKRCSAQCVQPPLPVGDEGGTKCLEMAFGDGLAGLAHQIQVEMQVVHGGEVRTQHFAHLLQVVQITT